jgi:hypothetical protein
MTTCRRPPVWPMLASLLIGPAGFEARAQSAPAAAPPSDSARAPLTMAVSMFSAFEGASVEQGGIPREQGQLNVALGWTRQTRRHALHVSAASVVPYAGGVEPGRISYAAGVSLSSTLGRRTRLEASQSMTEQPFNIGSLTGVSLRDLSTPLEGGRTHAGLFADRETRLDGAVTLSRTLSPRSSAVLSYTNTSSRSAGRTPSGSQLLALRFTRRVFASGVLHAGYGFGSATFATPDAAAGTRHDLDLGIGFDGPLPFSSRTMFAASTGSTIVTDGVRRRLRLVAQGSLSRALSQRWSSRIEYSRPMQFVAGFQQPLLSDAVHLTIDGRVAGGWNLSWTADAARGSVGFDSGGRRFNSYSASLSLHRQVSRQWRFEAEGFASSFQFSGGDGSASALPAEVVRRGIRVGLSWSTPLERR